MPKVSVIIPAYNASAFIGKCLESIQCQTLSDIEVIVVDDGSTDNTREIVGAFASKDVRISLIKQQNSFAGVARNNGMKHAEGEYLYFLDADDFIAETMLEDMVDRMEIDSSDVALCRSEYYDNNNGKTWDIDYSVVVPDLDVCYNEGQLDDSISNVVLDGHGISCSALHLCARILSSIRILGRPMMPCSSFLQCVLRREYRF